MVVDEEGGSPRRNTWTSNPAQSWPKPVVMFLSGRSTMDQQKDHRVRDLAYLCKFFISCAEPASKENLVLPVSAEAL